MLVLDAVVSLPPTFIVTVPTFLRESTDCFRVQMKAVLQRSVPSGNKEFHYLYFRPGGRANRAAFVGA